jgi:hypothetical protein
MRKQRRMMNLSKLFFRDPEAKSRLQEIIQKQVENGEPEGSRARRPHLQAVRDHDGKEIAESLLLDWERRAADGGYQAGIRPDFNTVLRLLNLAPATTCDAQQAKRIVKGLMRHYVKFLYNKT